MAALSALFVDEKGDEVELNEGNIPGPKLPKPIKHCLGSVLKWWLSCRVAKVIDKKKSCHKVSSQFELRNFTFHVLNRS